MRTRPLALAFSAVLVLSACAGSGDDEPTATLAPVAPSAVPGAPVAPGTPGTPGTLPGGNSIPGTTQVDFGPPPGEMLTTADLATVPAAAGFTVRETFRPKEVPGLCGEGAAYAKAWAAEATNPEDVRLYGQVVYDMDDTAAAQALLAKMQRAEVGCEWTSGQFTTKFVSQETGVTPAGESMFAYRASFSAAGTAASGEPGLGVYVQRGSRVIFLGAPATTTVEAANALIAAALA